MLNVQHRHQQPWVKCCENKAAFWVDGVPLCGTHINKPPKQYVATFPGGMVTTEKAK